MNTDSYVKSERSKTVANNATLLREEEEHRLPPVRRGLTIVACLSTEVRRLTRETFIRAALTGGDELPVRMPKGQKVTFLCAGSRRDQDLMKASLNSLRHFAKGVNYDHQQVISVDAIDWTSPAGLSLVEQKLMDIDGWLVLEYAVGPSSNALNIEGLVRIQQIALRFKKRVLLTVVNPNLQDASNFLRIADEYFECSSCEPDPGWDEAVIIDCVALTRGLGHKLGKVMCLARHVNGSWETRILPFVSVALRVRLMAILRAMGKTQDWIGSLVGLDKSGVCRQLKGIPLIRDPKFSQSKLKRWYDACGILQDSNSNAGDKKAPSDMNVATEVDETNGIIKVVAQKKAKTRNKRNLRNKQDKNH